MARDTKLRDRAQVEPRSIVVVLVAALIAVTLFSPIQSAVSGGTGDVQVDNETVTASVGEPVQLEGYQIDDGSEIVLNGSDSVQTSGTDYELGAENGSIVALGGGTISDGEELDVSYTYSATDSTTETVATLVPLLVALMVLVVIAKRVTEAV